MIQICSAYWLCRVDIDFYCLHSWFRSVLATARKKELQAWYFGIFSPFSLSPSSSVRSLPFSFLFVSILCPGVPSHKFSYEVWGSTVSFLGGSMQSLDNRWLLMHSELKITLPMLALLQKFSYNQTRIVTCIGAVIYWLGISQKRTGSTV